MINGQTNLRLRSSHRTLLGVLTNESGHRTITGLAETSSRLLAEAVIGLRLAHGGRDPRIEVVLSALNAAAHEAYPLNSCPWYRILPNDTHLQRWSIEHQAYIDVGTPYQLPQAASGRR